MRNFFLFGLALVIFGVVILSHVPRGLTVFTDVEMGRVAYMTSGELNDSNAVENNGIRMKIIVPDLVALAIPENKPGAYTPVKLDVNIANDTSIRQSINIIGTLIPELIAPDGQPLQWQQPREWRRQTEDFTGSLVRPGEVIATSLEARLTWHNNVLQLEIPDSPDYYWQAPFTSDNYWFSAALHPGTYQLRFVHDSPTATGTGRLATPFVKLSLVYPTETNRNAVEVEGIRFETVMPERVLILPEERREVRIPVQLGIRITNNTNTPRYFNCFDAIIPSMMGVDRGYGMDWLGTPQESDFPLAVPGESVTFFPGVSLLCLKDEQCVLVLGTDDGGVWNFGTLSPGSYQFQFQYINKTTDLKFHDQKTGRKKRVENVWVGLVSLPSVEFSLVRS